MARYRLEIVFHQPLLDQLAFRQSAPDLRRTSSNDNDGA
jgi:hypothetical protein